jgi:assimilatory nitrate reductase catalytic subunit
MTAAAASAGHAKETRSTCPYCGVGCGVVIESAGGQITGVRGDPDHPANLGRLCTKGSTLALSATAEITLHRRLHTPTLHGQPVSWQTAITTAASRISDVVAKHGPDAVGLYLSGQLLTEDYYVFNKLAKGLIGTNNVDTNSRLCMSSAVAGYKATLGADAPPCSYDDLAHAGTVFIAGSNMAWAHPVLFRRLEDAKQGKPDQKWIVVDPRRTETAAAADLHLAIQPGTDVALFHGMLHLLLWEGLADTTFIQAHTTGFAALRDRVRDFAPREVAKLCGVKEADLVQAARWFAQGPTLSLYCQGLNQSRAGTAKNATLINLHLATGHIGKVGAGPFSLTGQPNAMGGREVGGLANLLSAHRDLANPQHRAEVAALWGVPSVPSTPGKTAVEMFEAAADGQIKALWIACTNPAQSLPDQATVRRALQRAEFVIVQEAFAHTATTPYAHLLLPASSWGEKEGTVTNSERRISRVRTAVPPPGHARADWHIAVEIAREIETHLRSGLPTLFNYDSPEQVWNEHRESTRGRDLDITGLSYTTLESAGPQQWPMPDVAKTGANEGQARLYTDHHFATPDGKARFFDTAYVPVAEPRDARYPFSLNTGRLRDQWHGMSRTGTVSRLFGHTAEPSVDMHPQDMARLKLVDGNLVRVQSRRGSLVLPARSTTTVAPTQLFVPMHWGQEFVSASSGTSADDGSAAQGINAITSPALCPQSKQPELKHAAVRVEKARLPWQLLAAAWLPSGGWHAAQQQLRQVLAGASSLGYTSVVPFGQHGHGLLVRAAASQAPDLSTLVAIEQALGMAPLDGSLLRFADTARQQRRTMRLQRGVRAAPAETHSTQEGDVFLTAFMLAGDASAEAWVRTLMQDQAPVQHLAAQLLRPGAAPPGLVTKAVQVCNCFDVSHTQITESLATCEGSANERLAQLQSRLKCGTLCGSCLPALRQLVTTTAVQAVA